MATSKPEVLTSSVVNLDAETRFRRLKIGFRGSLAERTVEHRPTSTTSTTRHRNRKFLVTSRENGPVFT